MNATRQPVCLTIAGLDPSGGAGVIADVRTFAAFGCRAAAAVTSVTFQNATGVFGAEHQTAESVRRQITGVAAEYDIAAVKTGMLPTREIVEVVAELIEEHDLKNVVVDPVIRSTSGFDLIDADALAAMIERLFPLAHLITPNIPEAEAISGIKIASPDDIRHAVRLMQAMAARNVLIKGGHHSEVKSGKRTADDHLFIGDDMTVFEGEYIDGPNVRGTGCMLSSAIAAGLADGKDMSEAVRAAKQFVTAAIRSASSQS